MPIIKRYPNRKLYNTQAKQYITLQGIAELIFEGEEVQVIDHATREDLSAVTLTQILFELEKKSGFLPLKILANLIKVSNNRLDALQRYLTSRIGPSNPVDEEIKQRIQILVQRGELAETEGKRLQEKLIHLGIGRRANQPTPFIWDMVQFLEKQNIPTRDDLEPIMAQLDSLSFELENLYKAQK